MPSPADNYPPGFSEEKEDYKFIAQEIAYALEHGGSILHDARSWREFLKELVPEACECKCAKCKKQKELDKLGDW